MANKTRLDQAIFERGLVGSRTKAAALVMAGQVKVDGKVVDKPGFFVKDVVQIDITAPPPYVSRGGEKLASVAGKLKLNFKDKIVLDVGSSTGGFTDFALQHGAKHVYAVDVGTGQLDWKLRNDKRVSVMERTDIRKVYLRQTESRVKSQEPRELNNEPAYIDEVPDIVLIDVSFISLRQILPHVSCLMSHDSILVAMAKPHFEADYVTASKNKGVIKNDTIRRDILKNVEIFMKRDFVIKAKADSQVAGRKGNLERFYLLQVL